MIVVEEILGNVGEDARLGDLHRQWQATGHVETVELTALEAQKARLRTVPAGALGLARQEAMLIELYTFTASVLGAAMRLIRLDHEAAQLTLGRLKPLMVRVVEENIDKGKTALIESVAPRLIADGHKVIVGG